jgi:hypothetical protein
MNIPDSDKASSDAPSSTQAAKTSDKPTATQSGDHNDATQSGDNNDNDDKSTTGKASATGKQSGTKTTGKGSKSTSFDARLPAGGLTMVTPAALAGTQFYKVGDWVTFAWNFTSVSVMPTAVDVLASCTANQATYTIAVNISAKQTEVLWNTGEKKDGQAPFLTENYKLIIYDSDTSVTAPARAGYLGAFSGLTFGMYLKQDYVSLAGKHSMASVTVAYLLTNSRWVHMPQLQRRALTLREDDPHNHALHYRNNGRLTAILHLPIRPLVVSTQKCVTHATLAFERHDKRHSLRFALVYIFHSFGHWKKGWRSRYSWSILQSFWEVSQHLVLMEFDHTREGRRLLHI